MCTFLLQFEKQPVTQHFKIIINKYIKLNEIKQIDKPIVILFNMTVCR